MSFSSNNSDGPISEINVTPLVDVMLVLLIIFMITAPMMTQALNVDLPQSASAEAVDMNEDDMLFVLTFEKKVLLGKTEIAFDQLEAVLKDNQKIKDKKEVFLQADHRLPYGDIVKMMSILRASGAESIGMVTEEP